MRRVYLALGVFALLAGAIGVVVPLLPTVPFMLLAAFFFARSNPACERRLLEHPRFGPPIRAWRERGAISRQGKAAATLGVAGSAALAFLTLHTPWQILALGGALFCAAWILSRPEA